MLREEKILQLREQIARRLDGLVDRDYVLLDLPYYLNVGDILIWEGEREYLSALPYRCLNKGFHYRSLRGIRDDTLIILQGGGNFGDLWRLIQEGRLKIIRCYSKNPVLILPVSCWYKNDDLLRQDAEIISQHPGLTICARDTRSFDFLRKHFNSRILLVPDMALYIPPAKLRGHTRGPGKGTLFLKRTDKELAPDAPPLPKEVLETADVRDWPSVERDPPYWILYQRLYKYADTLGERRGMFRFSHLILKFSDWYFHRRCREQLIQEGARFIGRYRDVYTTRLHGCILALLLDRQVTLIDNSYGKNSSFFETWLKDTDGVKLWR